MQLSLFSEVRDALFALDKGSDAESRKPSGPSTLALDRGKGGPKESTGKAEGE